jgi:50S ribosomal protein L16 3-hydroxylase
MNWRLLGGLAPRTFLRRHWQKRPLFVPGALAAAPRLVDERALTALARRDDVESRIVERRGRQWETRHGPFDHAIRLERRNATLLVSGVNLHLAAADRLLRRFDFVPQARLDDVMVSFATPGGGVGPHVDSYDVFLLQGAGTRKWRVWNAKGKLFSQCLARPGDLLYLPPGWKHDGVALEPCFTYSIGFRAPRGAELGAAFLDWLHARGLPDASYRDADLRPARSSGAIPARMLVFTEQCFSRIRWTRADIARFLGEYLTLPKAHVVFRPSAAKGGRLRLDPKTQLLYAGGRFFINGEEFPVPPRARAALRELADRREIGAARVATLAELIGEWRRAGYVHRSKKSDG